MSDDPLAVALDELAFAIMCCVLDEQVVEGDDPLDFPPAFARLAEETPPGLRALIERLG